MKKTGHKQRDNKTIDWDVGLKLANNKPELAKELLTLFVSELPQTRAYINQAYQEKDVEKLHQQIHKLHGATCYCGVPRLKETVAKFETLLKSQPSFEMDNWIKQINDEIDQILHVYKENYQH